MFQSKNLRPALLALLPVLLLITPSRPAAVTAAPAPAPAIALAHTPAVAVALDEYVCSGTTNVYRYHPTNPTQFCHPVWGWGSWGTTQIGDLPEGAAGSQSETVLQFSTPAYTSSASYGRSCEASDILGLPVAMSRSNYLPKQISRSTVLLFADCTNPDAPARRVTAALPAGVDVFKLGCTDADEPGKPCYHRNRWSVGPQGGWSQCDLVSCETRGHRAQLGYDDFIAHYEVWSKWVDSYVLFNACGAACAPPTCTPGDTSPACTPCPSDRPADCTPPPYCERFPADPVCVTEPIPDLRFEVTISLPQRFSAKGSTLSQGATVTAVELYCQDRPCLGEESSVGVTADSLTGRLVLSPSATYSACSTRRSTGCGFYVDRPDSGGAVMVGDLVGANFFTPTRAAEQVFVRFSDLVATVDRYESVPVLVRGQVSCAGVTASYCRGRRSYEDWVPSGERRRQFVRTDTVRVVVRDQNGTEMPTTGFSRAVIGTVGG